MHSYMIYAEQNVERLNDSYRSEGSSSSSASEALRSPSVVFMSESSIPRTPPKQFIFTSSSSVSLSSWPPRAEGPFGCGGGGAIYYYCNAFCLQKIVSVGFPICRLCMIFCMRLKVCNDDGKRDGKERGKQF